MTLAFLLLRSTAYSYIAVLKQACCFCPFVLVLRCFGGGWSPRPTASFNTHLTEVTCSAVQYTHDKMNQTHIYISYLTDKIGNLSLEGPLVV